MKTRWQKVKSSMKDRDNSPERFRAMLGLLLKGQERTAQGNLCLISTMRTGGHCEKFQELINADQAMATVSQSFSLHTILQPRRTL